jgi:RNA polymerase sigma-70 factor (ECF subfamily)
MVMFLHGIAEKDDNELIVLVLNGNKRAYELIVFRYQKLVFNVIYQIVRQQESAADMTQETFLKAYQALPSFRAGAALRPWLLRIATNTALNHLRSAKPYQSLEQLLEELPGKEPVSNDDVEGEVESKLIEERLMEVLETLPPQHRNLFLLRYQHDLSYEEIATVLEQPITTIKSLLFRVRSKVRLLMAKHTIDLSTEARI